MVRLQKTIIVDPEAPAQMDPAYVNPRFYNGFNYSLLPRDRPRGRLTIGVTSPRQGDGKSLVASNLAVSLAITTGGEVVLLDLNLTRPKIHKIFGVPLAPGLLDSLNEPTIRIRKSKITNLWILPSGNIDKNPLASIQIGVKSERPVGNKPTISLEQLVEFRNVLFSLEEQFELILVDLPSIDESVIPTIFMKQLDGVVIVVNAGKTRKEEIDDLIVQLSENHVLGFVLNRAPAK